MLKKLNLEQENKINCKGKIKVQKNNRWAIHHSGLEFSGVSGNGEKDTCQRYCSTRIRQVTELEEAINH